MTRNRWIILPLLFCLLVSGTGLLQAQAQTVDRLARLRNALERVGAPALTATQEQQINALITSLQGNRPAPPAVSSKRELENAILNGDEVAASALATAIANQIAGNTVSMFQSRAAFGAKVVKILRTNDNQVGLLQQHIGAAGVIRLVESLAGGPGGRRRPGGMGGAGRMGMGPR